MEKVILQTANTGDFVVAGKIPHFVTGPPEVIYWGIRTFKYSHTDADEAHVYVECFSVALVQVD